MAVVSDVFVSNFLSFDSSSENSFEINSFGENSVVIAAAEHSFCFCDSPGDSFVLAIAFSSFVPASVGFDVTETPEEGTLSVWSCSCRL